MSGKAPVCGHGDGTGGLARDIKAPYAEHRMSFWLDGRTIVRRTDTGGINRHYGPPSSSSFSHIRANLIVWRHDSDDSQKPAVSAAQSLPTLPAGCGTEMVRRGPRLRLVTMTCGHAPTLARATETRLRAIFRPAKAPWLSLTADFSISSIV